MKQLLHFFQSGEDKPVSPDLEYINQEYKRHRRNIIWVITLCYGLGYVCRLAFNVVKKPLMDSGVFTPEELGIIGSSMLYGYALGKFTNGLLADHAHVGRFFAAGLFLSAMSNLGMSFSDLAWVSALLWGLNGWFQGFGRQYTYRHTYTSRVKSVHATPWPVQTYCLLKTRWGDGQAPASIWQ